MAPVEMCSGSTAKLGREPSAVSVVGAPVKVWQFFVTAEEKVVSGTNSTRVSTDTVLRHKWFTKRKFDLHLVILRHY
jgi:hypothetical protein